MIKYCSGVLTDCVYLNAPRPWEKIITGHFTFDLNGASKLAGILKEPEIKKQNNRVVAHFGQFTRNYGDFFVFFITDEYFPKPAVVL